MIATFLSSQVLLCVRMEATELLLEGPSASSVDSITSEQLTDVFSYVSYILQYPLELFVYGVHLPFPRILPILSFPPVGFSLIIEPFDDRAPTIYNPVLHFRWAVPP